MEHDHKLNTVDKAVLKGLETLKVGGATIARDQLLQLIMDNIPQYIFWKDLDSVYLGCNKNFAKAAGFDDPADVIGKNDYDLPWKKEETEFFRMVDQRVMKSGKAELNLEEPQLQADGREAWLRTNKVPLKDESGSVIGILGTFEDITEKKQSEVSLKRYSHQLEEMVAQRTEEIKRQKDKIEELLEALQAKNEALEETVYQRTLVLKQANEQLRRTNRDLEQFAYIASHDLQEPLRMIGNFVQLLERQYGDLIDQTGKEYIGYTVEGVTRMSQLITSLLHYYQIEQDYINKNNTISLNKIVNHQLKALAEIVHQNEADISIEKLPEVKGQPEQIGMVLYHLIHNGIKFNNGSRPQINIREEGSTTYHWQIAIEDNGMGIDPAYKDRIFGIFKRLNPRNKFEGNGIGLAICQRIIEVHQGRIWFHPKPQGGTIFYFTLPK